LNIDSPPIIENSEMQALDAFPSVSGNHYRLFHKKSSAATQVNSLPQNGSCHPEPATARRTIPDFPCQNRPSGINVAYQTAYLPRLAAQNGLM